MSYITHDDIFGVSSNDKKMIQKLLQETCVNIEKMKSLGVIIKGNLEVDLKSLLKSLDEKQP